MTPWIKVVTILLALVLGSIQASAADSGYQTLDLPDAGEYKESWLTANKLHLYLGLGSMAAAIVTAATAPEEPEEDVIQVNQRKNAKKTTHYYAAMTAAALGGAAVASGFLLHWDDITNSEGLMDPDVMHLILGLVGTAGYLWAISKAPKFVGDSNNGHSAAGILGGALMATAIVIEW